MKEIKHLSVHQWLRSAIPDSQQPSSPIGFLFLKLPPPPCAVLLVCTCVCASWMWRYPKEFRRWSPRCLSTAINTLGIFAGQSLQSFESSSPEGSLQRVSAGGLSRLPLQFSTVPFLSRGDPWHSVTCGFYMRFLGVEVEQNKAIQCMHCIAMLYMSLYMSTFVFYSRLAILTFSEIEFTQSRKGRRFGRRKAQMALPNHSCKRRARHAERQGERHGERHGET